MPVISEGIGLNSDVVSAEQKIEVYGGVDDSEFRVSAGVSTTETLIEKSSPVSLNYGFSDEKMSTVEFVDSGGIGKMDDLLIPANNDLEGTLGFTGAEIATNGNEANTEPNLTSNGDLMSNEDQNVDPSVFGALTEAELVISAMEVETQIKEGENQVMGVFDSEAGRPGETVYEGDNLRLVVDLKFETGMERVEGRGVLNVVDLPYADGLPDNSACFVNGIDVDGNQDAVIGEQMMDIEQPQDTDMEKVIPNAVKLELNGNGVRTEKEGEFHVSDLVWGKVRSHPWWPGQIFHPSDSSAKGMKYYKKESFLIAYFGDQTFAWNDASSIKPFRAHFTLMEKQSSSEAFGHATDCALDEVSRRVEFGLACSCLLQEVYDKIKYQIIVNPGIREESSKRYGGDEFSSTDSFNPLNLVQFLKETAQSPHVGTDRLEFVISRAQLLAFKRWKGYYQLPEFNTFGPLVDESDDILVSGNGEKTEAVLPGNREFVIEHNSSLKRKRVADIMHRGRKEKSMSDLMVKDEKEPLRKSGRKTTSFNGKEHPVVLDSKSDDLAVKSRKTLPSPGTGKPNFSVGDAISKVAKQLTVSTPILKSGPHKAAGNNSASHGKSSKSRSSARCYNSEKSLKTKITPLEFSSKDMLSQLCSVAKDPTKGYGLLIYVVSLFSDFRNSICLENNSNWKIKNPNVKLSDETSEEFEGAKDSYRTDRTVESNPEDQELFEPETANGKGASTAQSEVAPDSSPRSESKPVELGKAVDRVEEKCAKEDSPAALILNFTDLASVPSGTKLNDIFKRFGPLKELETEVLTKRNRAKVVFKRRSDAETAFSSAGKFSIFGPSLVSYRLNYLPYPCKNSTSSTKRKTRGGATSAEG